MNPAEFTPGQLNLEIIATNFLGEKSAKSFFVTIPVQPPPNPELPEKPTFAKIERFRDAFGLDRNPPLSKPELTELALTLLYEFETGNPIAVRSTEEWGVPMRQPEVEEMEARERFVDQAAQVIPEWAEEHAPSTYGGFYVDERAGSKIYVGFTSNQAATVEALKASGLLIAPSGQVAEFPVPPTTTVTSLEATEEAVFNSLMAEPSLAAVTKGVDYNPETNKIEVATTNPTAVSGYLTAHFGAAPIRVYESEGQTLFYSRYETSGPVAGGQAIFGTGFNGETAKCTAGFGARAPVPSNRGSATYIYFSLTVGHCYPKTAKVFRSVHKNGGDYVRIGSVTRSGWGSPGQRITDGAGVNISEAERTHGVFFGNSKQLLPMQGVERARIHMWVCWSGWSGGVECGKILYHELFADPEGRSSRELVVDGFSSSGDSGAPVWSRNTEKAVGIPNGGIRSPSKPCHVNSEKIKTCPRMTFTPLYPIANRSFPAGIAPTLGVEVLKEG